MVETPNSRKVKCIVAKHIYRRFFVSMAVTYGNSLRAFVECKALLSRCKMHRLHDAAFYYLATVFIAHYGSRKFPLPTEFRGHCLSREYKTGAL